MWILWNTGEEFTSDMIGDYVGFVYLIENRENGKSYIGKKHFQRKKTYQKNKKKRSMLVESDWQDYVGSNKELQEDVKAGHAIDKYILHLCTSKGWMSYYETLEILQHFALEEDSYYNNWVSCKIQRSHLK